MTPWLNDTPLGSFLVAGALALALVSWTSTFKTSITALGPEWAIPTTSRALVGYFQSSGQILLWSWDSKSRLIGISQGDRYKRGVNSENQVWEGQNGAMRRRRALLTFTLHSTAGISFIGGNAYAWHSATGGWRHLCPESSGNSGRTRAGTGMTLEKQRGPLPLCQTDPKSGILSDGSTSILPAWVSVLTESRPRGSVSPEHELPSRTGTCTGTKEKTALKPVQGARPWTSLTVYVGHNRHVVRPDYDTMPPENGEKTHQSQEDSPELQAIYVPREELSCPFPARRSAFEDRSPACHWYVRRDHMATVNRTYYYPAPKKSGVPPL